MRYAYVWTHNIILLILDGLYHDEYSYPFQRSARTLHHPPPPAAEFPQPYIAGDSQGNLPNRLQGLPLVLCMSAILLVLLCLDPPFVCQFFVMACPVFSALPVTCLFLLKPVLLLILPPPQPPPQGSSAFGRIFSRLCNFDGTITRQVPPPFMELCPVIDQLLELCPVLDLCLL